MNKRIVFRGADVGYTEAFDLGVFKGVDEGVISCLDVMLDCPHTKQALEWIKERPWISFGWHRHLWESPVCKPEEVPSLVDGEGRFKWRHARPELMREATYEDAYKEFEAELKLCYEITGRYPDSANPRKKDIPLEKAFKDICDRYHIPQNVFHDKKYDCDPDYISLDYHMRSINPLTDDENSERKDQFDLSLVEDYDPCKIIMNTKLEEADNWLISCHPGYLDDHILAESRCNIHRVKELSAYLDNRLKKWIIKNRLEISNQRDILYGSKEYQDHLRQINSPLWLGNMYQSA